MKTIEEAALECNKENGYQQSPCYIGFLEGVKFAKRFIPYSEEEPPTGETVLVKLSNDCVFTGKYIKSAIDEKSNVWDDGFFFYRCANTSWRPIELK